MWEVHFSTSQKPLVKSGLLFKLQAYGVEGRLLALLKDYLDNHEQRVALNNQTSDWRKINSGVLQGSVLGPLLFLISINDLPDGTTSICKLLLIILSFCQNFII